MSTMTLEQAIAEVNDAANDARHRGDYGRANNLVHARVALYQAAHLAQPAQAKYARCDDCHEPVGSPAFCETCVSLRCESVAQTVDVEAIREVAHGLSVIGDTPDDALRFVCQGASGKLTRALSGEKAGPVGEIPLDDCVRSILGKPCFTLIHLANALRKDGHKIWHKAEDEQAVCLHWMLNLYLKHGTEWGKVATAEIERIHALPASPTPDKEGQS